ncbi:MAG: hypothetical protein ABI234_03730 [Ktedonobacteraceae bacterium]
MVRIPKASYLSWLLYFSDLTAYNDYVATWKSRLPESDLNSRALKLALQKIERSLR